MLLLIDWNRTDTVDSIIVIDYDDKFSKNIDRDYNYWLSSHDVYTKISKL